MWQPSRGQSSRFHERQTDRLCAGHCASVFLQRLGLSGREAGSLDFGVLMIERCASFILAFILISAGISKAIAPQMLKLELTQLGMPAGMMVDSLAWWFPWAEIACGCGLLSMRWKNTSARVAFGLSLLFTAFSLLAWSAGYTTVCGCFGALPIGWSGLPWSMHTMFSIVMVALGWFIYVHSAKGSQKND